MEFPVFLGLSTSHNQKVHMHMLDLMSSIITEGDGVTQELLDTILINLIPAHKVSSPIFSVSQGNSFWSSEWTWLPLSNQINVLNDKCSFHRI